MKPVLKWAGGKASLFSEIKKRMPEEFNTYYEPFVGGGSVLINIEPQKAFVNDVNNELINLYKIIKNSPDGLIEALKQHTNTSEHYYEVRNLDRNHEEYAQMSDIDKAARVVFLNHTCFNGLYRVNSKGEYNTPFGKYKNPKICDEDNIIDLSKFFNEGEIIFSTGDFENFLSKPQKGDFVYLDPPYDPLNSTSFTTYASGGFTRDDQTRLKKVCDEMNKRGVRFLLSNSSTDFIKDLYKQYNIDIVYAGRNINSDGAKREKVPEVLVRNY